MVTGIMADQISTLARAADAGQLDALPCPSCAEPRVSVSFTHATTDHYRVYFTCSNCTFRMSGGHVGKPRHFSEDRIDPDLQAFDLELLQKMKFSPPE